MTIEPTVKEGVVAELDGRYWLAEHPDNWSESVGGFGSIEFAKVADPRYCRRPTDMVYAGHYLRKGLEKATLRKVKITTTYEIE